jgi:DNA-binding transcriptional LysR family regulator
MTLEDLRVFVAVASERSFSRAARKLRRTQPAISQAIRRLEDGSGERLIDRGSRDGRLTDAGGVLLDYATRLLALTDEASDAVGALRDLRAGRVAIASNEGGVYAVLPVLEAFARKHPTLRVDVRRMPARQIPQDVLLRTVDFGILTFNPAEKDLLSLVLATDELVLLVSPSHPLATRSEITMEEMGRQAVIAHNDPSPARERVLRLFDERHATLNICVSLPSMDGIKRAVEAGLGVALLPRRCAERELAGGQLVEVRVPELRTPRHIRFVYRRTGDLSHAAQAFLDVTRALVAERARRRGTADAP